MKIPRIYLLLLCFCFFHASEAQTLYPDGNIRKCLNQYLRGTGACPNELYDEFNLFIRNLLSKEYVVAHSELKKIGIYGFEALSSHQYTYIFLKYFDDYEILKITDGNNNDEIRDYSAVLDDLQSYFDRHPELDSRLLPFYHKAVNDTYVENTKVDQLGSWFEWYETDRRKYFGEKPADSIP